MHNKIILIGNLSAEPVLRFTKKGNSCCTLEVGTKGPEGKVHVHKAILWGKQAEVAAKYSVKGSRVYLEGDLRDKGITVTEIKFLGGLRAV